MVLQETIGATGGTDVGASAGASYTDGVTFGAQGYSPGYGGYLSISPSLTGDFLVTCSSADSVGACYTGSNLLSFVNFNQTNYTFADQEGCCTIGVSYKEGTSSQEETPQILIPDVIVPIAFGQEYSLTFSVSGDIEILCGSFRCAADSTINMTGTFVDPPALQVLDANMQPIANAALNSIDGINYSSTAPEPATWVQFAAAAAFAGLLYRNRTARQSGLRSKLMEPAS